MGSTTGIVLVSSPFKNSPSRFLWSILLLLSVFSYPPEVHSTVDETLLEHRSNNNNNGPPITLASYDRISTNPACQSEVTRICGKRPSDTLPDFDALECILNQRVNSYYYIVDIDIALANERLKRMMEDNVCSNSYD
jgi:hypothetical protein